jgi:hypothetical protein
MEVQFAKMIQGRETDTLTLRARGSQCLLIHGWVERTVGRPRTSTPSHIIHY